jgi:hypothetical protein
MNAHRPAMALTVEKAWLRALYFFALSFFVLLLFSTTSSIVFSLSFVFSSLEVGGWCFFTPVGVEVFVVSEIEKESRAMITLLVRDTSDVTR